MILLDFYIFFFFFYLLLLLFVRFQCLEAEWARSTVSRRECDKEALGERKR